MSAPRTRIGLREIRAMSSNETIFDGGTGSVPGFGARRRAGPHVSYFIMYRTLGWNFDTHQMQTEW